MNKKTVEPAVWTRGGIDARALTTRDTAQLKVRPLRPTLHKTTVRSFVRAPRKRA